MELGVHLLHDGAVTLARAAEDHGYVIALAPEGYRSDAPSVLGAVATATDRITLASGVMQIPARPAILTALTAMTLNTLSGGRFRLGLGVSNPEISESWYGVPFDRPLARTGKYVRMVRAALRGEDLVHATAADGDHPPAPVSLPVTAATAPDIHIYLAAGGPGNLRLSGRIADGWIGMFASPEQTALSVRLINDGAAAANRSLTGFDYLVCVPAFVADDPARAADRLRAHYAHLLGLGGPERNIYAKIARTMGFAEEMAALYACIAAGDRAGAAQAVPYGFIDATALIGPVDRVAEKLTAYAEAGATTVSVMVSSAMADTAERVGILGSVGKAWGMIR